MKIKVGDNVAVIDDVFKGKVVAIEKGNICLETEDGFLFKYKTSELVVITENQKELSKFSDITNEELFHKIKGTDKNKPKSKFKTSNKLGDLPPMEVDLHIHNLVSSTRGMDNSDMLNLQIDTAKHKLEFAIRKRIPKVVFIHGVGEGVLKSELEYLFKKYPVSVSDASYKKYGLGATEVYIYQNPKNK